MYADIWYVASIIHETQNCADGKAKLPFLDTG